MKLDEITSAILSGSMDDHMAQIKLAMDQRKQYLKATMMRKLVPGDMVVVDNIRPKAICGLMAKVNKVNRTTLSVTFGPDAGRYAGPCKVPASCCAKVQL